jgi:hypothetical protein
MQGIEWRDRENEEFISDERQSSAKLLFCIEKQKGMDLIAGIMRALHLKQIKVSKAHHTSHCITRLSLSSDGNLKETLVPTSYRTQYLHYSSEL